MLDTVKGWLPQDRVSSIMLLAHIPQLLSGIKEHKAEDGQVYISGFYGGNYRVFVNPKGLSMEGSLSKYYLGDNCQSLTRQDTGRAIERLSDELHLPMSEAKLNRIDIAQHFIMKHPIGAYYPFMGECQYYQRAPWKNSLYYKAENRTLIFYDKLKEAKKKGVDIPGIMKRSNNLRYELRYTKRLPRQFKRPEVRVKDLYEEGFYMTLVNNWHKEYHKINKLNDLKFNPEEMSSPKDFIKLLTIYAIQQIGQDKVFNYVECLKAMQAFKSPEYYSRLKADIKQLSKTPDMTESSDLTVELDKKINRVTKYCR